MRARQDAASECTGKRAFVSYRQAEQRIARQRHHQFSDRRLRGEKLVVYKCAHCGSYHVGSSVKG